MKSALLSYLKTPLTYRYSLALGMIVLMVAISEIVGDKEIIFPEMAALTIGFWVIDKQVWFIKGWQLLLSMTLGACIGVSIVLFSSFPLLVNLMLAFITAATMLYVMRATLFPLISACVLPVLLHTESWVYPLSVCIMTLILMSLKHLMDQVGWRKSKGYEQDQTQHSSDIKRWIGLTLNLFFMAVLAQLTSGSYLIIPPLIVTFVEFSNSRSGFRNRPVLTVLLLFTASLIGSFLQLVGYYWLDLPQALVALLIISMLFGIFLWLGKLFAPAAAMAIIPLLLPCEALLFLPLQVLAGAVLFISISMVFFQKCYKWSRAQLVYCLIPHYLVSRIRNS